jgi:hypothetical protein
MRLPCLGTGFVKRIYAFAAVKGLNVFESGFFEVIN